MVGAVGRCPPRCLSPPIPIPIPGHPPSVVHGWRSRGQQLEGREAMDWMERRAWTVCQWQRKRVSCAGAVQEPGQADLTFLLPRPLPLPTLHLHLCSSDKTRQASALVTRQKLPQRDTYRPKIRTLVHLIGAITAPKALESLARPFAALQTSFHLKHPTPSSIGTYPSPPAGARVHHNKPQVLGPSRVLHPPLIRPRTSIASCLPASASTLQENKTKTSWPWVADKESL